MQGVIICKEAPTSFLIWEIDFFFLFLLFLLNPLITQRPKGFNTWFPGGNVILEGYKLMDVGYI